MRTFAITLHDGRQLDCLEAGAPDGTPLLFHNGTPGSRRWRRGRTRRARPPGCGCSSLSWPGDGGSTPQPGRSVADVAADSAAVLDSAGVDRFAVWGHSGGGPHSLACAALLPVA